MALPSLILTATARAALFDPPIERDEALRRCVLTLEDVALARRHRRAHNRLGFAVQLALVRDLGRPLRPGEIAPAALVEVIAEQLGTEPAVFELYARRDETRRAYGRDHRLAEAAHDPPSRLPNVDHGGRTGGPGD